MKKDIAKVLEKKTIWEGKFLRFVLTTYIDSYGAIRQWESFERVNCKGIVAILPVTDNKEVLLIRQFRPPVNRYVIEFPAGLNDKGDTLEEAAKRELLEEAGYSARELFFLTEGVMSSGASGEILTVFLAKGLEFKGIGERDETEDIEVLKIPINELYQKLDAFRSEGNYIDLKIYGLIELAKIGRLIRFHGH
ncbi:MAG: ADP-ribose pyrophosphatase [Nitrospirae bacterium CG_4_10_14_0_8_um_filter_41_23]|nr:NUDIX hydrolase [Nitrospirota bacterium]PIQ94806.1 MAG: ADP-ribose pyrophosphatase [Nitrospirae bacterium CG11_big_fil_rev_8_21_14_0_20_41_14]PIV42996.1 MAG: ADP-ribose pyrophosphatase [Nitrospirae bacterium CG02_land_8_20_14_3_00_41_53]PIW86976.1 MAG: ADP-ribose pyrophosphatase [Nitrospirae bacterium CG_4_8_14_3_um_filter_41_47]PIY87335.1 MAG: ADP-ribose pyrophosphatase [Nitrospirae bacterium CG_4_10_14_0_8_um_filter_41_23]PJA79569.1 MAG: ADP-ribose pyrophosphatase [Nitrospirae bacterium C